MYDMNSITISPVANGWILRLPEEEEDHQMKLMRQQFDMSVKVLKNINKDLQKDPLLSELQGEPEEESLLSPKQFVTPGLPKVKNVFIFKTFPEVLSFLGQRVLENADHN